MGRSRSVRVKSNRKRAAPINWSDDDLVLMILTMTRSLLSLPSDGGEGLGLHLSNGLSFYLQQVEVTAVHITVALLTLVGVEPGKGCFTAEDHCLVKAVGHFPNNLPTVCLWASQERGVATNIISHHQDHHHQPDHVSDYGKCLIIIIITPAHLTDLIS